MALARTRSVTLVGVTGHLIDVEADLGAHLARARGHGATIVQDLQSHGFTSYVALDLEGRRWRFAQARPTQPG